MTDTQTILDYIRHHFLTLPQLLQGSAVTEDQFLSWVADGLLPRASYHLDGSGIHSGIGHFAATGLSTQAYWAPDTRIWLIDIKKRAARHHPSDIAAALRAQFRDAFHAALQLPLARHYGWTAFFAADGKIAADDIAREADENWDTWLAGTYGVCLRHFSADTLVKKVAYRAQVRALTADGTKSDLDIASRQALAGALRALDDLITDFAPHERPGSTRGLWIDNILEKYRDDPVIHAGLSGEAAAPRSPHAAKPASASITIERPAG